ncbi:hypothetical protein NDU88_002062 [Pleurodeles waltl]|uniref:Uncharacterized protein n=1 Tax=Pleurodeles waltl TaxID=8319 RepID=A0AAV7Q7N2_PLEWA|nr:hypothetical protein NDU88_002062 [Pleurodeles waltl]
MGSQETSAHHKALVSDPKLAPPALELTQPQRRPRTGPPRSGRILTGGAERDRGEERANPGRIPTLKLLAELSPVRAEPPSDADRGALWPTRTPKGPMENSGVEGLEK